MIPERVFQYAKSTDPEVVATVQRNWAGYDEARIHQGEWCKQFGADYFCDSGIVPSLEIISLDLPCRPKGFGQWASESRGYRPAKNNPLYKEMRALDFHAENVPGMPGIVLKISPYLNGSRWGNMRVFHLDGTAWAGIGFAPTEGEFGRQWDEALASEFHAALETFVAQRRGRQR